MLIIICRVFEKKYFEVESLLLNNYSCISMIAAACCRPQFITPVLSRCISSNFHKLGEIDRRLSDVAKFWKNKRDGVFNRGIKCSSCFMVKHYCICSLLESACGDHVPLKANVLSFMHYKEYGAASNTGKLLTITQPDRTANFMFANVEDEIKLASALEQRPSFLLFPSVASRPLGEYYDFIQSCNGDVNLCVIDSTWSQGKAMERLIPSNIPRVNINDIAIASGPSVYYSRKQTICSRISTIEAIARALEIMGENPLSFQYLVGKALPCSERALFKQSGNTKKYGMM